MGGGALSVGRVIRGADCVAEGAAHLAETEPRFRAALALTGPLPLRLRDDGFSALLDAIVSQQVSRASADAIWRKLEAAALTSAGDVMASTDEALRACGLSRQKMRYARALAEAGIDYEELRAAPTARVVETLVEVPGIGNWTAEVYAMFSLRRADVFAPGDLALQEAARVLFALDERPREKELRAMAQAWSPWRSVAARILWAYYRTLKNREGIR